MIKKIRLSFILEKLSFYFCKIESIKNNIYISDHFYGFDIYIAQIK